MVYNRKLRKVPRKRVPKERTVPGNVKGRANTRAGKILTQTATDYLVALCTQSLPYVKLCNIAFDEALCKKYDLCFDVKMKKEEMNCNPSDKDSIIKNMNKCNKMEDSIDYKKRKKKVWNIKYHFHMDKITSHSDIFLNAPLNAINNNTIGEKMPSSMQESQTEPNHNDLKSVTNTPTNLSFNNDSSENENQNQNENETGDVCSDVIGISNILGNRLICKENGQICIQLSNNSSSSKSSISASSSESPRRNLFKKVPSFEMGIGKINSKFSQFCGQNDSDESPKNGETNPHVNVISNFRVGVINTEKPEESSCLVSISNSCANEESTNQYSDSESDDETNSNTLNDCDMSTDSISTNSSLQTPSLSESFVAKEICVPPKENSDRNFGVKFKKPLLPSFKRPPSRRSDRPANSQSPIISSTRSENSNNQLPKQTYAPANSEDVSNDDFDVISLCASSCFEFTDSQKGSDAETNSSETVTEKQDFIEKWITTTAYECIPKCLENVCRSWVKSQKCWSKHCLLAHVLPVNMSDLVSIMDGEELIIFKNYLRLNEVLLQRNLPIMIERAKELALSTLLIQLIEDVLQLVSFEKTPHLNMILEALQTDNKPLHLVVNDILVMYGCHGSQEQVLCDILLSIIATRNEPLIMNWPTIEILVKYRKNLDFGVVSDIMEKCINEVPVNPVLMQKISKDILKTHNILFNNIPNHIIKTFIAKLHEFQLFECKNYLLAKWQINQFCSKPIIQNSANVMENVSPFSSPPPPLPPEAARNNGNIYVPYVQDPFFGLEKLISEFILASDDIIVVRKTVSMITKLKSNFLNKPLENDKLQQLVVNVLYDLILKEKYKAAMEILNIYNGYELQLVSKYVYFPVLCNDYWLKYLLMVKVLVKNNAFQKSLNLLLRRDWKQTRLNIYTFWKKKRELFMEISKEFLAKTLKEKPIFANKLIIHLISNDVLIDELNLWYNLNASILQLLQHSYEMKSKEHLWSNLNVYKTYHIHIHKQLIRMLLILFFDELAMPQRIFFYGICRKMGLYFDITGHERILEIPRNLTLAETYLLIHIYFTNMNQYAFELTNVIIKLGEPMAIANVCFSIFEHKLSAEDVYKVLTEKLNIRPIDVVLRDDNLLINLTNKVLL